MKKIQTNKKVGDSLRPLSGTGMKSQGWVGRDPSLQGPHRGSALRISAFLKGRAGPDMFSHLIFIFFSLRGNVRFLFLYFA